MSAGTGEFVDEDDLESLESSAAVGACRFEPDAALVAAAAEAAAAAELRAAITSREGAGGRILASSEELIATVVIRLVLGVKGQYIERASELRMRVIGGFDDDLRGVVVGGINVQC